MFPLVLAWTSCWTNNPVEFWRHDADVTSLQCHANMTLPQRLYGPLTRYAKLRVAHAPGMPGTFSPPPLVSYPDKHYGTCLTHVPWCMPGSLTSGFLWSRWRGKRFQHSRRMRTPQFCVSGKRPMMTTSDGNAFRLTDPLWRESIGHWILLTEDQERHIAFCVT